jgi:hypothetical protein
VLECFRLWLREEEWCLSVGKSINPTGDIPMLITLLSSSGKMPQAVREALTEVFQNEGVMSRSDAEGFLSRMEKDGKYKQETW